MQYKQLPLTARLLDVLRYFGPFGFLAFGSTPPPVDVFAIIRR